MNQLMKYRLPDGEYIYIESQDNFLYGTNPVGIGDKVINTANEMVEMCDSLTRFVKEIRDRIRKELHEADEITLEFGIKIGAEVGLIIAKSQVESNFNVTISWKK
jgi:hypothetical protein